LEYWGKTYIYSKILILIFKRFKWDWFAKKHIGGQFVEEVDSISANIAEGFGRYH